MPNGWVGAGRPISQTDQGLHEPEPERADVWPITQRQRPFGPRPPAVSATEPDVAQVENGRGKFSTGEIDRREYLAIFHAEDRRRIRRPFIAGQ